MTILMQQLAALPGRQSLPYSAMVWSSWTVTAAQAALTHDLQSGVHMGSPSSACCRQIGSHWATKLLLLLLLLRAKVLIAAGAAGWTLLAPAAERWTDQHCSGRCPAAGSWRWSHQEPWGP